MADVERSVKIAFEGDDKISPIIDTINGKITGFASTVQGVTGPLADMAAAVLKTEAAFAALAVGGLAYAFAKSTEFESATIELKKVIGDEIGSLEEARQKAIAFSDQYGESASKILASTANFKQAGFDIQESFTLTKAAMDLVIAGSLSSAEASDYLISILKGFKAPGTEATQVIDILNEVSNRYATDVRQLAIAMGDLSPIAKLMGFSMGETAGLVTPVIEVFRDGSEAANALKTGLLKLVDDRSSVTDALKAIGVSQFDLNGNLRSGKDILYDVSVAFTRLTDEEKIYFAQALAGIEQGAKMVEVFNGLAKSQEITAVAMNAAGSAATEVKARLESAEVSINRFKVGFENLGIVVGDQFRLAAQSAVDGGTAIELALRNAVSSGTFKPIFDVLNQFSADIGAILQQVAKNLPAALAGVDFSGFLSSIKNLGSEVQGLFEAFFGKVDLTTAEGLRAAIQKIVDGLTALTNVTAGILSAWEPFVKILGDAATKFAQTGADTQTLVGNILGFGQAIDKVLGSVGAITGAIQFMGGAVSLLGLTQIPGAIIAFQALGLAGGALTTVLSGIGTAAAVIGTSWVLDKILSATLPGWEANKQAITDNITALTGAADATGDWIGATNEAAIAASTATDDLEAMAKSLFAIPEEKTTTVSAVDRASPEFQEILKQIEEIPFDKQTTVTAEADTASIENTKRILVTELPDGVIVLTQVKPDEDSISATQNALTAIPDKKTMEIMLQGEINKELAEIKANAETIQTAVEWKARLDIAEAEAAAKTIEALAKSTSEMFKSAGDTLVGLSGALKGVYAPDIFELMQKEIVIQQQLADSQVKMNDAQIEYMKARTAALNQGQGMITISAEGLEPELEMVLQKIIQLTQIRANEEGLKFLLGV